jgi:hypothetical protein
VNIGDWASYGGGGGGGAGIGGIGGIRQGSGAAAPQTSHLPHLQHGAGRAAGGHRDNLSLGASFASSSELFEGPDAQERDSGSSCAMEGEERGGGLGCGGREVERRGGWQGCVRMERTLRMPMLPPPSAASQV